MATARMDVTWYVGKLLEEEDVDLLRGRPGARPGPDGDRGLRPDRGGALRAIELADRVPQRVPDSNLGHTRGHDRAQDPQGHRRHVLPLAARAPSACGAGPAGTTIQRGFSRQSR